MATFEQIKQVRLTVDDPSGFLDILESSTYPLNPAYRTAYLISGRYVYTNETSGASEDDYTPASYRLSDAQIGAWIDSGKDAVQEAYKAIIARIGNEMLIVRSQTGAESTQFVTLKDLYDYYKSMIIDNQGSGHSGRWAGSTAPEIAGGNL